MKKITITALLFLIMVCSLIGFSMTLSTTVKEASANYEITLETQEIQDVYNLNQIVEFPATVQVNHNESDYTAKNGVIVYPSGQAYSLSKHSLDELGQYSVKYFFDADDQRITAVKNFKVISPYYGLAKEDGSNLQFPTDQPVTFNGREGFRVNLKDGNEFVFSEPIDLNATSGSLAPIINITPVMGDHSIETVENDDGSKTYINYYSAHAKYVIIKLTDCYDSNKFVEILYHYNSYYGYLRTRTNSQTDVGIGGVGSPHEKINRPANQKNVYQDGLLSSIWIGEYGTGMMSVFTSKSMTGAAVLYDNVKNRVWFEGSGKSLLVTDLMNTEVYGDDVFDGFTTGEVYLSLRAEEFVKDTVAIDIHSIGNYSASQLIALKDQSYSDVKLPQIKIDVKQTDENGVYAAIGDTVKIPSAYSQDVNALGDLSVKVYRNYGSENQSKVAVINGCFKVESSDVYTIEYSQKDSYGNVGKATLDVYPKFTSDDKKSVWLEFDSPIEQTAIKAGIPATLPTFTVDSLNIPQDITVKMFAKKDGEIIEIDSESRTFIPQTSGEYVITFALEDNFGYREIEYTLNCGTDANAVQFKEVPVLPQYFIKGQTYNIGEIYAYEYSTGKPVKVGAQTYAIFDGGAETLVADTTKLKITADDTVSLVYKYNGKEYATEHVKVLDVSYVSGDVTGIDVFKYFVSDDVTYEDMAENKKGQMERVTNATFTAKNGLTGAKIAFANAISVDNFTVKYEVPKSAGEFNTVRFTLTGVLDPSEKVVIEIKRDYVTKTEKDEQGNSVQKQVEVSNVYTDGKFAFTLSREFAEDRVKTISYNDASSRFSVESGNILKNINISGSMCYLTIEMLDITGKAGIEISQINNQILSGKTFKDTASPEIVCNNSQGEYNLGEKVNIFAPLFSDVLSQIDYSSIKLTVSTHSGATVTAVDGTVLSSGTANPLKDYQLVLDRRETYYVNYAVKDYAGKSTTYNYMMYVIDMEAPVIELTGDVQKDSVITIDAGDSVSVEYQVTDNVSAPESVQTYVHLYVDDTSTYIQNVGDEFTIEKAGNYTVKIIARDQAGNMTVVSFKVIVK